MNKITIAIVLSAIMLVSAGCAGLMDDNGDSGEPEMDDVQDDVDTDTGTDDVSDTDDTSTDDSQDASSTDDGDSTDSSQDDSQSDTEPSDDSPEVDDGMQDTDSSDTGESNGDNGVSDSDDETDDGNDETSVHTVTVETTMDSPDLMVTGDDQFPGEVNDGTTFDIEEGSYDVIVEVSGDRSLHFVEESEQTLTVDGDTTWTIEVGYDGAPVTITVVDENGDPIEGAFAGIEEAGAGTGSDGIAEFDVDVRYDMYNVEVSADGYETNIVEIAPGESTTVTLMEESENFSIPVTVTDAETGEPIEGADVTAHPVDASGLPVDSVSDTTDESGTVTLTGTGVGTSYDIVVEADGYEDDRYEYRVGDEQVNFELTPTNSDSETTIRVYDENDEPFEGVTVAVADILGETDEHGVYTFDYPYDSPHTYDIEVDGYDQASGTVEGGEDIEVELLPLDNTADEGGILETIGQLLPVAV